MAGDVEPYGVIANDFSGLLQGFSQMQERLNKLIDHNITLEAKLAIANEKISHQQSTITLETKLDIANKVISRQQSKATVAEFELKQARDLITAYRKTHPNSSVEVDQSDGNLRDVRHSLPEARPYVHENVAQATVLTAVSTELVARAPHPPEPSESRPRKVRKRHHPRETFSRGPITIPAESLVTFRATAGHFEEATMSHKKDVTQDEEIKDAPQPFDITSTNRQARRRNGDIEAHTKGLSPEIAPELSLWGIFLGDSGYQTAIPWQFLPGQLRSQVTKLFSDLDMNSSLEKVDYYKKLLETPGNDGQCVRMRVRDQRHPTNAEVKFGGPMVACRTCTNKALPCVRVRLGKMVVVALPSNEIPLGVDAHNSFFWVKDKPGRTASSTWQEGGKRKSLTESDETEEL